MNYTKIIIKANNILINIMLKLLQLVLIVFVTLAINVSASENQTIIEKSQITNLNNYAESFCTAKANNFFEGLDNEKTLKFSYFKYIGSENIKLFNNETYKVLVEKIKNNCDISNKEEKELFEFFLKRK